MCDRGDVPAVAHPRERDRARTPRRRGRARRDASSPVRGDVQDAAAVRDERGRPAAPCRRGRRAPRSASASVDAVDRRADVACGRVVAGREHDRHRRASPTSTARRAERSPCAAAASSSSRSPSRRGSERLRLRVAEAAVELEHPRAVGGQHQAGEEHADERRAARGELVEHGLVDRLDELLDVGCRARRPASTSPCRPVFGPSSPSPIRLKSCAAGSGSARAPSQSANTETSSPSSSSSITIASPNAAAAAQRRVELVLRRGRRRRPCRRRGRPP